MEEKYLDIQIIKTKIYRAEKIVSRGEMLAVPLFLIGLALLCSLGSVASFLVGVIISVVILIVFTGIYLAQQQKVKAIENLDFCLVEDICVKKEFIEGDVNADDHYILYLKKHGKYVDHHDRNYAGIAVGDVCYLLQLGSSRKTCWVTNKYAWQGLVGFEKRGDAYFPTKQ